MQFRRRSVTLLLLLATLIALLVSLSTDPTTVASSDVTSVTAVDVSVSTDDTKEVVSADTAVIPVDVSGEIPDTTFAEVGLPQTDAESYVGVIV